MQKLGLPSHIEETAKKSCIDNISVKTTWESPLKNFRNQDSRSVQYDFNSLCRTFQCRLLFFLSPVKQNLQKKKKKKLKTILDITINLQNATCVKRPFMQKSSKGQLQRVNNGH